MILRISAENFELSDELSKYTNNKLDGLSRFVPRKHRATALVEVVFSEQQTASVDMKSCQLDVKFRREDFAARETTQHLYAALDVAVASVEQQLRDYKKRNPSVVRKYLRRN